MTATSMANLDSLDITGQQLCTELDKGFYATQKEYERKIRNVYVGCEKPFAENKALSIPQIVAVCRVNDASQVLDKYGLSNFELSEIRQNGNVQLSNLDILDNSKLDILDKSDLSKIRQLDNRQLDNRQLDNSPNVQMSKNGQIGQIRQNGNVQLDKQEMSKNVQLDKAVQDAQRQIERLAKQKATVDAQLTDVLAKVAQLEERNAELSNLYKLADEKLDNERKRLQAEKSNLSKSASEQLDKQRTELVSNLETEKAKRVTELDKQRTELVSNFEKEKTKLNTELDKLRTQLNSVYQETNGDFAEERKALLADVTNARREAKEEFAVEKTDFLSTIGSLRTQLNVIRTESQEEFRKEKNDLLTTISSLRKQLETIRHEVKTEFNATIAKLENEIRILRQGEDAIKRKLQTGFEVEKQELLAGFETERQELLKRVKDAETFAQKWEKVKEHFAKKPFLRRIQVAMMPLLGIMAFQAVNTKRFIHATEWSSSDSIGVVLLCLAFSFSFQMFGLLLSFNVGKVKKSILVVNEKGVKEAIRDANKQLVFEEKYNMNPILAVCIIFFVMNIYVIFADHTDTTSIANMTTDSLQKSELTLYQKFGLLLAAFLSPLAEYFFSEIVLNIVDEDKKVIEA